jgi:hypothetical protein
LLEVLTNLPKALVHVRAHGNEPFVHPFKALTHERALLLELLFHSHHALTQLDLAHRRRPAQLLLGQPFAEMGLDAFDDSYSECYGIVRPRHFLVAKNPPRRASHPSEEPRLLQHGEHHAA